MRAHHKEKAATGAAGVGDSGGKIAQVAGGESIGQGGEKVAHRGAGRDRRRKLIVRNGARQCRELARAGALRIDGPQAHGNAIVPARREIRTAHNAIRSACAPLSGRRDAWARQTY